MPDQVYHASALRVMARESLSALQDIVINCDSHPQQWPDPEIFIQSCKDIKETFKRDLDMLESSTAFLDAVSGDADNMTDGIAELLQIWQSHGVSPSLYALCVMALEKMEITPKPDMLHMVLMSALLAGVPNDLPYHDNMHFKKVLLNLIVLVMTHNDIYAGSSRAFNADEVCTLLSAACIHDLGHDGKGNVVKGVHIQGRMERYSFELAKPYFQAVGMRNESVLNALCVMLLSTDVSPLDDPGNPMHQMKAAYRFHYLGEKGRTHSLNLVEDLDILEKDGKLTTMCLILHEADIATSAGLTYDITKYETSLLREEFCGDQGKPSHAIDFFKQICNRRFLSDAGQKLYAANMARIYTLAEDDLNNGDEPYPKAEHADFIIGQGGTTHTKTIN